MGPVKWATTTAFEFGNEFNELSRSAMIKQQQKQTPNKLMNYS
jgi:hypothetical protein